MVGLVVQMVNISHLFWIIPSCLVIGYVMSVFMYSCSVHNGEADAYTEGFRDGYNKAQEEVKEYVSYRNTT